MSQITLRGLDPDLEREIRKRAKETGRSLNRVIMDMIYKSMGVERRPKRTAAASLKELAGGWSDKEAAEFLESIQSCEQVDEEMWK